jgi:hypothetical protein
MKKTTLAALAIAGSAMLGMSTAAPAMATTYSSSHDYVVDKFYPKQNNPSYWGYNCKKVEPKYDSSKYYLPYGKYSHVVVKAGTQLTVFKDFYGSKVYSKNGKDISYVIYCPVYKSY